MLEIRNNESIKRGFLAICTNTLSHVQNCIAVCKNHLEVRNCKYKLLTESDVDSYNIMLIDLFNCIRMNRTLHILLLWLI
jgi:hypothetical protein